MENINISLFFLIIFDKLKCAIYALEAVINRYLLRICVPLGKHFGTNNP